MLMTRAPWRKRPAPLFITKMHADQREGLVGVCKVLQRCGPRNVYDLPGGHCELLRTDVNAPFAACDREKQIALAPLRANNLTGTERIEVRHPHARGCCQQVERPCAADP